eukprot:m.135779 g.135779  ORF g.135779 m.135779 type:complete len:131 (+) comp38167_c0_seq3:1882-2274(+)
MLSSKSPSTELTHNPVSMEVPSSDPQTAGNDRITDEKKKSSQSDATASGHDLQDKKSGSSAEATVLDIESETPYEEGTEGSSVTSNSPKFNASIAETVVQSFGGQSSLSSKDHMPETVLAYACVVHGVFN